MSRSPEGAVVPIPTRLLVVSRLKRFCSRFKAVVDPARSQAIAEVEVQDESAKVVVPSVSVEPDIAPVAVSAPLTVRRFDERARRSVSETSPMFELLSKMFPASVSPAT